MDEVIIRVLQGRGSPQDDAMLNAWRSASDANERMFQEISAVWAEFPEKFISTTPPPPSVIVANAQTIPLEPPRDRRRRGWVPAALIAASVAVVLAANLDWQPLSSSTARPSLRAEQVTTAAGETVMTQLSDGTIVHLAPNSHIHVMASSGRREVWLEGRAFFGVASHGDQWPFVVRSRLGDLNVVGTRFEIATSMDDFRVVVVDGQVNLATGAGNLELGANQVATAGPTSAPVARSVDNVDELLGWMGTSLVFHETPLAEAVREIERRFDASIELTDDALGEETISGGFQDRTFNDLVATICRVMYADCAVEESHAVISPRRR